MIQLYLSFSNNGRSDRHVTTLVKFHTLGTNLNGPFSVSVREKLRRENFDRFLLNAVFFLIIINHDSDF